MLRARRTRNAAERATASPQCDPSNHAKIADSKGVKRPLEEATAEETKKVTATQLLATNAAVTDADLDALLPDEGYETLPPPKQDAEPKG